MPLSPGFPAHELRYILDNSEASILLSSTKFKNKTEEVFKDGLEHQPILSFVEKRLGSNGAGEKVELQESASRDGGLMLYTSGTTNRPVSRTIILPVLFLSNVLLRKAYFFLNRSSRLKRSR